MFNERYGLQSAVFEGRKTQTRREPFFSNVEIETHFDTDTRKFFVAEKDTKIIIHTSRYAIGEIVAIAERYNDSMQDGSISSFDKGWKNKMFVKAELMPHHIKIIDIRCERLQDICNVDCISEGISMSCAGVFSSRYVAEFYDVIKQACYVHSTPNEAFRDLIGKLNGKKFWETNPYVIVYEFEKID